ncbi:MAG TPA: hypothetical protein VH143_05880 [Kofleriaceae bacterium]|jgi:hypothetical protein|nr:hypothetical protein [Kofleriaceae bacterium]
MVMLTGAESTTTPGSAAGALGSLSITSVEVAQMTGSGTDYTVHGSFSATCAQQGGSGSVMMAMSF